ncbi:Ku protein [Occultella aeris]|uniref:Non-homologous end joining protein Ku n=1 Tax=Occultella aeris TaxID=2761496 RepID=A0A7M4DPN8_9MICO|nr:Ku protein [Occultella aeris]VZO39432.1 putative DNA repair protein YkoV [Occultella aeris]
MARSIWTGALAFGLVNVPVGLYSATEDKTIHFRQFAKGTSSRIRYKRVNEDTGREVDYDDIVKGYELDSGEYVLLDPDELDEIAPGRSRTIDITDFVDAEDIDPIHYQKTYYLAPANEAAERAYRLLTAAMEKTGRIAIANFVMRSKQYLAAVRPHNGVLTLETMFFADEIRDPKSELPSVPAARKPGDKDLKMATSLIDSMTSKWDPANYVDTYREKVLDLVQAKAKGEGIVTASDDEDDEGGGVIDLMEALRKSVEASRQHKAGNRHQAGGLERKKTESADAPDVSAKSKKQLYDLAKDYGVEGRSQMTKDELADAITEAAKTQKKKAS